MGIFNGIQTAAGLLTPFRETVLPPALAIAELFDLPELPLSPIDALKVPSIARGRAILHSLIGAAPLRAYDNTGPVDSQPTWLYRSDTRISPRQRTTAILDDIIFREASLLTVQRGAENRILDAAHVPYDNWRVNADHEIEIRFGSQWYVADDDDVVWIPGPGPGLLVIAEPTIRAAREMDLAWARRVRNPLPAMVLQERDSSDGLNQEEATAYVEAVAAARRNIDNAVMYLPNQIELITHASEATDLFETGRNALRLDVANYLNMPAAILDGSVSQASLTYSTQEGRRNEVFDYTIPYWAAPIEEALSLDNVVPRGQRVRFDFAALLTTTASPIGAPSED